MPEPSATEHPPRESRPTLPALDGLETPAQVSGSAVPSACDQPSRYRVERLLAMGGLGEVHLAIDTELDRSVALKRIKGHLVHDAMSRNRFLREATITARLEHPGIVPIHGLVTDEQGQPCYAMRFIEGESLAEAIKKFHQEHGSGAAKYSSVAFRQLLARFITVCNTIAYAHSRGVLHRDLKPQNIMLGKYGETLVVDWGLAKDLSEPPTSASSDATESSSPMTTGSGTLPDTLDATRFGEALGTPAYMSPEQAAGRWDVLDQATDIYSLGATLYQQLTGKPAFDRKENWPALREKIQQGSFPAPHRVNQDVPRALEAICLKAMALEPQHRYRFALDLASDLERWLADDPVSCYREPWPARTWRWARKHRTVVTAGAAMLIVAVAALAIVAGIVNRHNEELVAKNEALAVANQNESKARERAQTTLRFLVNTFRRPDPALDGRKLSVYELLGKAVQALGVDPGLDPETRCALLNAIGETYYGLGEYADAVATLELARGISQEHGEPDRRDIFQTKNNLAAALQDAGKSAEALKLYEETLGQMLTALGPNDPDTLRTMNNLASVLMETRRPLEALPLLEVALKGMRGKLGLDNPDTLKAMNNLALTYRAAGRHQDALPLLQETLKRRTAVLGSDHPATLESMNNLALTLHDAGRPDEALVLLAQTREAFERKLGPTHPRTLNIMDNLAFALVAAGRLSEALPVYEETLARRRNTAGPDNPHTLQTLHFLGIVQVRLGKFADAEKSLQEFHERLKAQPDHVLPGPRLAVLIWLARLYNAWGKPELAKEWADQLPPPWRFQLGLERHCDWQLLWGWPRF